MKKGFTLVELLGVILILGILAAVSTPVVMNLAQNTKKKMTCEKIDSILNDAKRYGNDQLDTLYEDCYRVITVQDLVDSGYTAETDGDIVSPYSNESLKTKEIKIYLKNKRAYAHYEYEDDIKSTCLKKESSFNLNSCSDTLETYKIIYDANGGIGAPEPLTFRKGETVYLSTKIPSREGYKFLGWGSRESNNVLYVSGARYTEDDSITLYAVWKPDEYSLVFDAETNGGTGAPDPVIKYHDIDLTLPSTMPKKDGYEFIGWDTEASSTSPKYSPGDKFLTNKTTTLYAIFKKDVTLQYLDSEGKRSATKTIYNNQDGAEFTLETPRSYKDYCDTYDALGWSINKSSEGTITYQNTENIKINKDITLYAIYEKGVDITYDGNGGACNIAKSQKFPVYYNAIGNFTSANLTLDEGISCTREGYTFKNSMTCNNVTAPTNPAYTFYNQQCSITCYADWSPITYTVSYDGNGGENIPDVQIKEYGKDIIISDTLPTRAGYAFKGYSTVRNGEIEYQPGSVYQKDENVVLFAVWESTEITYEEPAFTLIKTTLQNSNGSGSWSRYKDKPNAFIANFKNAASLSLLGIIQSNNMYDLTSYSKMDIKYSFTKGEGNDKVYITTKVGSLSTQFNTQDKKTKTITLDISNETGEQNIEVDMKSWANREFSTTGSNTVTIDYIRFY